MGEIIGYKHGENSVGNVDPRLWDIVQNAIAAIPYNAQIRSGSERGKGDKGNHSGGHAIDVTLIDPATGNVVPDTGKKGGAASAKIYEQYAQAARVYQQEKYPDLDKTFRWGGGFKQGYPFDLMHLDITPQRGGAMAYYDWDKGFTQAAFNDLPGLKGQVSGGLGGATGGRLVAQYQQALKGSGGLMPPMNIPSVASATSAAYAPAPASKSSALDAITRVAGTQGPMGIPSQYDSPRTPQQVASLYQGILPRPPTAAPPTQAQMQAMRAVPQRGLPPIPGAAVSPRLVGNATSYDPLAVGRVTPDMDRQYDASNRMNQQGLGALLGRGPSPGTPNPAARAQLPSTFPARPGVVAPNTRLPVPAIPSSPAPVPRPYSEVATARAGLAPASIPQTDAERMWAGTNFRDPYDMPGVGSPSFADLQAKMAPRPSIYAPTPATMSGGMASSRFAPPPIPATMSRGLSASRLAPPSPMRAPVPATMSAGLRGVPSVPQRPVASVPSPQRPSGPSSPVIAQSGGYLYQQTADGWKRVGKSSSSSNSSSSGGYSAPQSLV